MKFNHFCLFAGFLLLILSMSVFANADCFDSNTNEKSCSSCDRCDSGCSSNLSCGSSVNTCNNGTFTDVADTDAQYRWSCVNGDNSVCCRLNKPVNGVCGTDINSCTVGNFADVNDTSSKYKWNCEGLYNGTTASCAVNNPCGSDLAPYFLSIPNKTITYKGNIKIDLWNYLKDYDDFQSELDISSFISGGSSEYGDVLDCNIVSNRYLECSVLKTGKMGFSIHASDSCQKSASSNSFTIEVTNSAPSIYVPNQQISCTQGYDALLDLYDYSSDEDKKLLQYEIISQSSPYFAPCVILDNNHSLSCVVASCNEGVNNITVRATDVFGLTDETEFALSVKNNAPVWEEIPSVCIEESDDALIDLSEYVFDTEDGDNLKFELSQQSVSGLDCSLDGNFVSCDLTSNKHLSNRLDINAVDSNGKVSGTSVIVSANCSSNGEVEFEADTYGVCLEKCASYALPIYLKNDTNEKRCFDFDSESSPYNYLSTSISQPKFCLNSNEETTVTLNVNSCGADERKYTVSVFDSKSDLNMDFKFEVGTCSKYEGLKVEEFDGVVCEGERKDLSVLVKNTSSDEKKIYLSAENELVLPHFDREYVLLDGGESEYVPLTINAKALKAGDSEAVTISADADEYHVEKQLYFDVIDCSDLSERSFALSSPNVCFDVKRGQTFESQFTIRRESNDGDDCSTDREDFFLGITGAESELSYSTVSLKEGESRTILYSLLVPIDLDAGKNYVTINASDGDEWNSFTQTADVCINVLPESSSDFIVKTQAKDIIWCGSNVFEVEVANTGDVSETYTLSYFDIPTGTSVNFSESTFTVESGESKIIYVSVSTSPNAKVGDNQKIQLKLSGSTQLTSTIYFNIKEKTTFDDLQILSATSEIDMKSNTNASFDMVLRNNSETDLNNIVVSIESLPDDVNFEDITIASLPSQELVRVSGKIYAGDINGDFTPVFVVSSGQIVNKKPFDLHIDPNRGVFAGMFAGLFSFGPNSIEFGGVIGLVFLAIILIVLVWLITLGIAVVTRPRQKESWME